MRDFEYDCGHIRAVIEAATDMPVPKMPAPVPDVPSTSAAGTEPGPDADMLSALRDVLDKEEGWRTRVAELKSKTKAAVVRCGEAVGSELRQIGRFFAGAPSSGAKARATLTSE